MKAKHLAEHFTGDGERSVALVKAAQAVMEGEEEGSPIHTLCKALTEHFTGHIESCIKCGKAMTESRKADGGDDLEPLPAGFSKLTPTPPHVRAVPRAGMQQLPVAAINPIAAEIYGGDAGQD